MRTVQIWLLVALLGVSMMVGAPSGALEGPELRAAGAGAPADGQAPVPRSARPLSACPPAGGIEVGFTDVAGNTHEDAIGCLVALSITQGISEGRYGPDREVTRGQMASFLVRMLDAAGAPLPMAGQQSGFVDVAGTTHEESIERVAQAGIARGVSATNFDPAGTVRRDQMASFLVRTVEYVLQDTLASGPVGFGDIAGNTHERAIVAAATAGIAAGTSSTTFAPSAAVRRDQMGSFLARTLSLIVEELADAAEPGLAWDPAAIEVEIELGSVARVELGVAVEGRPDGVVLQVDGPLQPLLGFEELALGSARAGRDEFVLAVQAQQDAAAGQQVTGALRLVSPDLDEDATLAVQVTYVGIDGQRADEDLLMPAPWRIVDSEVGEIVADQVLAHIDGGPQVARQIAQQAGLVLLGSVPDLGLYQLGTSEPRSAVELLELCDELSLDPRVRVAHLSHIETSGSSPTNDPWWTGPDSTDQTWHMAAANVPEALEMVDDPDPVTVAIIDVEFGFEHEDLSYETVSRPFDVARPNPSSHGAHVAGIACATANNNVGISGVFPNCDLLLYDVNTIPLTTPTMPTESIFSAMEGAAVAGASVVNLSLENWPKDPLDDYRCHVFDRLAPSQQQARLRHADGYAEASREADRLAIQSGNEPVLWVAAAGNSGCEHPLGVPAAVAGADWFTAGSQVDQPGTWVSVANATSGTPPGQVSHILASSSAHDPQSTTLAAPGTGIYSTLACPPRDLLDSVTRPCQEYGTRTGTSMAAPMVSGAAALMFAAEPNLTAEQARTCLAQTAALRPVLRADVAADAGFGLLDVEAAVECAAPSARSDGQQWRRSSIVGAQGVMEAVTAGGPGLVAVGRDAGSPGSAAVWTSADASSFERVAHDEAVFGGDGHQEMRSVVAGGPGLVAVGVDGDWRVGEVAAVWTSADGFNWRRVPHDATAFGPGSSPMGNTAMTAVTAWGQRLVAVGYGPDGATAWTSTDGVDWQRIVPEMGTQGQSSMRSVTVGGPGLVAVGRVLSGSGLDVPAVWTSTDGLSWRRLPHDETAFGASGGQGMNSVVAGGPGLVAVGVDWERGAAAVWTSTDGLSWQRVPHEQASLGGVRQPIMLSVAAGGPGLVAVGLDGDSADVEGRFAAAVWTSADGLTWQRVAHDDAVFGIVEQDGTRMLSVTALGPGLVAVGADSLQPAGWASP